MIKTKTKLTSLWLLYRQLRSDVMSAHEIAAKEKVQRQQLEENMRRALLQGITAMNVKTLQLLNTNCEGKVMGDENK
jgi:hypothetical protein